MKKRFPLIIITITLLALVLGRFPKGVSSQEVTPSPTPKPTPTITGSENQDASDENIEKVREEINKKVQEKLQNILGEAQEAQEKRAWPGTITKIDTLSLTLKTRWGDKTVIVDEETKIVNPKVNSPTIKDLKVGQGIIAMGYLKSEDEIAAKRIVVTQKSEEKEKIKVFFGLITDKSEETKIIVLSKITSDEEVQLKVNDQTKITFFASGKIKATTFDKITINTLAVAIYIQKGENDQTHSAKIIHLISSKSDSLSPTPTAAKTPTPSKTPAE